MSETIKPDYYKQSDGRQTWDTIEDVIGRDGLQDWLTGTIIKYLARYKRKHPDDPTEDLRKADVYLHKLIDVTANITSTDEETGDSHKSEIKFALAPQENSTDVLAIPEGDAYVTKVNGKNTWKQLH